MGVRVKICGLSSGADVEAVAALAPDAMGFVFWPRSKRHVLPGDVGAWTRGMHASILRVGVFVDPAMDEVTRAVEGAGLDVVQLHGRETAAVCRALPYRTWKAFHLNHPSFEAPSAYDAVEAFLLDAGSVEEPGGTGRSLNWDEAGGWIRGVDRPVWLAGGLTPENVREAIARARPSGVDVSSGVERRPREKDINLVKAFIEACRSIDP